MYTLPIMGIGRDGENCGRRNQSVGRIVT